jgi:hypothetical protein
MVDGKDGAALFMQPELKEYSAWVIERESGTGTASDQAWSIPLER